MSKKYIIEIEEEPLVRKSALHGEDAVYRASGFKSLVFDQNGLDKLIPADKVLTCGDADRLESEGYKRGFQKGLKKAWEVAQWICECQDFSWLYQAFGTEITEYIIPKITVQEGIEAIEDYEDSSIVAGSEVEINDGIKAMVLDETNEDGVFYVLTENGCVERVNRTEMTTTEKQITSINELLDKLR
jgi:hypothetical protein